MTLGAPVLAAGTFPLGELVLTHLPHQLQRLQQTSGCWVLGSQDLTQRL